MTSEKDSFGSNYDENVNISNTITFLDFKRALYLGNGVFDGNGVTVLLRDSERNGSVDHTAVFCVGLDVPASLSMLSNVNVVNTNFRFIDDMPDDGITKGVIEVCVDGSKELLIDGFDRMSSNWIVNRAEHLENWYSENGELCFGWINVKHPLNSSVYYSETAAKEWTKYTTSVDVTLHRLINTDGSENQSVIYPAVALCVYSDEYGQTRNRLEYRIEVTNNGFDAKIMVRDNGQGYQLTPSIKVDFDDACVFGNNEITFNAKTKVDENEMILFINDNEVYRMDMSITSLKNGTVELFVFNQRRSENTKMKVEFDNLLVKSNDIGTVVFDNCEFFNLNFTINHK